MPLDLTCSLTCSLAPSNFETAETVSKALAALEASDAFLYSLVAALRRRVRCSSSCRCTYKNENICIYIFISVYVWSFILFDRSLEKACTRWRKPIGCLRLQVILRKRAINYRAFLRKMTCESKASYDFMPPCTLLFILNLFFYVSYYEHICIDTDAFSYSLVAVLRRRVRCSSSCIEYIRIYFSV